jgi:hypothetical protein
MTALLAVALHATIVAGPVTSHDGTVRLGDVVRLSGGDPATRRRLATRPLLRLPAGAQRPWSRAGLASLVRRAAPGLTVREGQGDALSLRGAPTVRSRATACVAAARDLVADVALTTHDVTAADCPAKSTARVPVTRSGAAVMLGTTVAAGTPLGRLLPPSAVFRRGDALTLRSAIGAVAIERRVVAAQDGRAGRPAFVRDADGHAFAVPVGAGR